MKRSGFRSLLALALTLAMLLSTLLAPVALAEEGLWGDNEWSEETYADMGDDEGVDLGEVTEDYQYQIEEVSEEAAAAAELDAQAQEEEALEALGSLNNGTALALVNGFYDAAKATAATFATTHYNKHSNGDPIVADNGFYVQVLQGDATGVTDIEISVDEYTSDQTLRLSIGNNAWVEGPYFMANENGVFVAFPVVLFDMMEEGYIEANDECYSYDGQANQTTKVYDVHGQKSTGSAMRVKKDSDTEYTVTHSASVPATEWIEFAIQDLSKDQLMVTKRTTIDSSLNETVAYGLTMPDLNEKGNPVLAFYGFGWDTTQVDPSKDGTNIRFQAYLVGTGKTAEINLSLAVSDIIVTFVNDGETIGTYKMATAGSVPEEKVPQLPEKVGYTFDCWQDEDGMDFDPTVEQIEDNMTLEACWTINTYNVWFNDYECDTRTNTQIVEHGATADRPKDPTDPEHKFMYWELVDVDGPFDFSTPITAPTDLYAKWGYGVTFVVDGDEYSSEIVEEGGSVVPPNIEDREDRWFDGWYDEDGDDVDFSTLAIYQNSTFYGGWIHRSKIIYFEPLGGTLEGDDFILVLYGDKPIDDKPKDPTKKGYTFVGWFDENGKAFDFNAPVKDEEDVYLTARWAINTHTITFDTDGGSAVAAFKADYGTVVKAPADPTKAGYTFTGWDKAIPETMPDEDVTVKAKWKVNQYTITFDTDGGSKIDPIKADFGAKVTKPADPTKTGYTFDGWEPALPETMPAENLTVKAKWKVNQYTITFDTDGGSKIDPIKADFGAKVTKPADPTKDGYTFDGWEPALPETMPAEDLTVKAKWTAVVLKGWKQDGGKWYYYDNGVMATGWKKINGNWFRFTASGVMQTGWQQIGKWYYFNPNGRMATGWQKISGVQYYFNGDGAMRTGWQNIEGKWYFFNNKGALQTGWQKLNDIWYHFADSGEMQTGWQKIGGLWYYFNLNGRMQTGWQNLGGKWYYLNPKGAMVTGWLKLGQTWYYLDENGAMITGWLKLGTKWYYLKANGAMVTGTQTINGKTYTFDANGAWVS